MSTSGSGFLDTIVGELVLLGGQRQSDATHMAVLTPPRRAHADRRYETLFVFLDLGGGGAGSLARVMLERFSLTYWRRGGTVTTALRQAINAANAHMLEENRLLAVSHRRRGGIVCAVLRENSLYLAQVGPAQALLAQGGLYRVIYDLQLRDQERLRRELMQMGGLVELERTRSRRVTGSAGVFEGLRS